MEVIKLNNHNSKFVINYKSGSNAIYLQKLVALHPIKKEEFEQIRLQVIDQKELSLYSKPLSAIRIIENSQLVLEESFAIIGHLTIELVGIGFVAYDFEVYFELK